MSIGILAFSDKGLTLGQRIAEILGGNAERCPKGGLAEWTKVHFASDDLIIFVGSCGIAVRAIAPHVGSKTSDPAVLVIDETGKFVISLLSGHLGGANAWAKKIADCMGAEPVITTATDRNGIFAVDTWAKENDLAVKNTHHIVDISSALLAGKTVGISTEFPVSGKLPEGVIPGEDGFTVDYRVHENLCLVPKVLTLGVGCRKGIATEKVEAAFSQVLSRTGIYPEAIAQVCSIDIKAEEPGLLEFTANHGYPFRCFTAEELNAAPGEYTASKFVKSVVGVDNVCERSAVLGSGGTLILHKTAIDGVTMALALAPYTIKF